MVSACPDRLPPPAVRKIPGDRLPQTALEGLAGYPGQLPPDLRDVHGISPVVAGPVRDKFDQLLARPMLRTRDHFIEQPADRGHRREIGPLSLAPDVVALPCPALAQNREQGADVIL